MALYNYNYYPFRRAVRLNPAPAFGLREAEDFMDTATALANAFLPSYFDAISTAGAGGNRRAFGLAKVNSKKEFEVKLDVSHFSPAELEVKTIDNSIVIEGKHEEREDEHGYISRSFSRRYVLPDGVKPENVNCKLTSDGFLVLHAPILTENAVKNERSVPITLTGEPAQALESETTPTAVQASGDQASNMSGRHGGSARCS